MGSNCCRKFTPSSGSSSSSLIPSSSGSSGSITPQDCGCTTFCSTFVDGEISGLTAHYSRGGLNSSFWDYTQIGASYIWSTRTFGGKECPYALAIPVQVKYNEVVQLPDHEFLAYCFGETFTGGIGPPGVAFPRFPLSGDNILHPRPENIDCGPGYVTLWSGTDSGDGANRYGSYSTIGVPCSQIASSPNWLQI